MPMSMAVSDAGRCAMISWRGPWHVIVEAVARDLTGLSAYRSPRHPACVSHHLARPWCCLQSVHSKGRMLQSWCFEQWLEKYAVLTSNEIEAAKKPR